LTSEVSAFRRTSAAGLVWALALSLSAAGVHAQRGRGNASAAKPTVDVVQTLGCVERRDGSPDTWWLTRAADPRSAQPGIFAVPQINAARSAPLGANTIQLVGVADFLDSEGLLKEGRRREFTTAQNANATGELRAGRKVLVKGMYITTSDPKRINLLNVIALADSCG
jgi:hypothetical protein